MPPLLAALLMIELGCDLRIVRAIDLGMEWRRRWLVFFQGREVGAMRADACAQAWTASARLQAPRRAAVPRAPWRANRQANRHWHLLLAVVHSEHAPLLNASKMPPLLAALLMMELGCDLRIVEAIDLGMGWRKTIGKPRIFAQAWYSGFLGRVTFRPTRVGTYVSIYGTQPTRID